MTFEWEEGMTNPFVVSGSVVTIDRTHKPKDSEAFKKGELIRISTTGSIVVASEDGDDKNGPVHGIALADAADYIGNGTGPHKGRYMPIALFTPETVIGIQLAAGKDQTDVDVGSKYTLAVASNKWTVTDTTANGIAMVVEKSSQGQWFDPAAQADLDRSIVFVKFATALLEGRDAE